MIRKINHASIAEFSEEVDVPKLTLQDILKGGNASPHTALHIARQLNVPFGTLTGEVIPGEKLTALPALLQSFGWFDSLSGKAKKWPRIISVLLWRYFKNEQNWLFLE